MGISNIYILINILIYTIMMIWAYKKYRRVSCTVFVFIYYMMSAIATFLFYNHPYTSLSFWDRDIFLLPLLYFAFMTFVMTRPIIELDNVSDKKVLLIKNEKIIIYLLSFMLLLQVIVYIGAGSYVFSLLTSMDMGQIRNDYATGDIVLSSNISKNAMRAWVLYSFFKPFALPLAVYALIFVKSHRRLIVLASISTLFYPIFASILLVMRSQIFLQIVQFAFFFLLLKNHISKELQKRMLILGSIFGGIVAFLLVIISSSRFDDLVTWMYYRYMGEPFVNFAGHLWPDIKGHTYGEAYFNYFFGNHIWSGLDDKWDFIEAKTGVDPHIFNTCIGQLIIEFGIPFTTLIYFIVSYIFCRMIKVMDSISLSNLIIVNLAATFLFYGLYIFPFQGGSIMELMYIYIAIMIFNKCKQIQLR